MTESNREQARNASRQRKHMERTFAEYVPKHELEGETSKQFALRIGKTLVGTYRNRHAAIMRAREIGGEVYDSLTKKVIYA